MTTLESIRPTLAGLGRTPTPVDVVAALSAQGCVVSDAVVAELMGQLRREAHGAGPVDHLLKLPGVSDVVINGPDAVYVDVGQGLERADVSFDGEDQVRELAVRLAAGAGRRLDDGQPYVDCRLPSGVRVHAVLGTLASPGTCISLRVPSQCRLTLDDWVAGGMSAEAASILEKLVEAKVSFLVSGGTGSGKTTLLATMLGLVPSRERLVIVEDSRELRLEHPHVVSLEARLANAEGTGAIGLSVLVRQALRMRPDRLIVGEVRGAEVVDLLMALNTGHEGGCGTIHANSAADVLPRLEALGSLAGLPVEAIRTQAASALQAVIHVRRDGPRRIVEEISVVERESGVRLASAFNFGGVTMRGPGANLLEKALS